MAGELSFFEIGVGDVQRARTFYSELFGWELEDYGGGVQIATPNIPGGIHGGDEGASPYVFFAVDDLDAAVAKVRELGGSAEHVGEDESEEIVARFGRFMLCTDDQGSSFGIHEPPGRADA
ncbi:MAG TPA: VOC family protein [Solirubrobacterales bacterium]|nr:VOC family protein [Solirubrobacterales bacterium]